ncbi:polysaccharide deacetylase family protein [Sinomonas mesophila]|uniref:polysaccharide deacetylase family protein n=1 Tax=Sinomonas mesophila TaxID=1531955 RepID=UPI001FE48A36|nr:polysaccharide deacetylase family protein [Sinomonas mesophila]
MDQSHDRAMPRLSRRAALAALGLVLPTLAACAPDADALVSLRATAADLPSPDPDDSTSMPVPGGIASARAVPSPTRAVPDRASLPSTAELVARFGTAVPREWGLEVTGVVTRTEPHSVALTFDACGGPQGLGFDERLITTLRAQRVPATVFLNTRWVAANPGLAHELAADPLFAIGSHGARHLPLSVRSHAAYGIPGTANVAEAAEEVRASRDALEQELQREIPWFRSGTAHVDDVAVQVCRALGSLPVNFSVNADGGATFTSDQVAARLATIQPGDISIGHMNRPGSGTAAGFARALPDLLARGVRFETLAALGGFQKHRRGVSPRPRSD